MNKFCCFITGGHGYAAADLLCTTDIKTQELVFTNYCGKCHKEIEIRIPQRLVMSHIMNER